MADQPSKLGPPPGPLGWYFRSSLLLRILAGMGLGVVVGLSVGPGIAWLSPLGDLLVRLLKMIAMPVIFFSLVVGAASISPARLGRVGVKVVGYYLITSAFAVTLGLLAGNLFRPGAGLGLAAGEGAGKTVATPSLVETLVNVVPTNPFAALSGGAVLPTIFFAILFGIGVSYLKIDSDERRQKLGATLLDFFEAAAEVMYILVRWVLEYAPIGVFALIAVVFGEQGAEALGPLASVTVAVYGAALLHLALVYGGALLLFGLDPRKFVAGAREAMVTAFVTRTSSGTLPVSMRVAGERLGVSRGIYSFTLPLGATVNMDGTAIYEGVCVLFVAFAIGLPLTLMQQITVVLTAVLASIGTAGVPGAGAIMLLMVLDSVGLPVEAGTPVAAAYAMVLGIDAILDMGRTGLNVTGDLVGTVLIAKTEGELSSKLDRPTPR